MQLTKDLAIPRWSMSVQEQELLSWCLERLSLIRREMLTWKSCQSTKNTPYAAVTQVLDISAALAHPSLTSSSNILVLEWSSTLNRSRIWFGRCSYAPCFQYHHFFSSSQEGLGTIQTWSRAAHFQIIWQCFRLETWVNNQRILSNLRQKRC